MISDLSKPVFLGVVVQPKFLTPVYVIRKPWEDREVAIQAMVGDGLAGSALKYREVASGELDTISGNFGAKYVAVQKATKYFRCHTTGGVPAYLKGLGYGTSIYTALVVFAAALIEKTIHAEHMIRDARPGICSDGATRSREADAWWDAAIDRGIAEREDTEGEEEEEEEELEDENIFSYMTPAGRDKVRQVVDEMLGDYDGWYLKHGTRLVGNIMHTVMREGEGVARDMFSLKMAETAKLIAVREECVGGLMAWAKSIPRERERGSGRAAWESQYEDYKNVLLALNVSREDPLVAGRLALCAQRAGATETEVTMMVMRNRFGVDSTLNPAMLMNVREVDASGPRKRVGEAPRVPSAPIDPIAPTQRNPPPTPSPSDRKELERGIDDLERRREDLGWDKLKDLP